MRWLMLVALLACRASDPVVPVPEQEAVVGCGVCQFGTPGSVPGCEWAVVLDGNVVPALGNVPKQDAPHGPDGMCTLKRTAVVAGRIEHRAFFADKFELLPITDAQRDASKSKPGHLH